MELRIIILSGAQSHICKCKKQQFCKTGNIKKKIVQLAVLVRSQIKI